jgi:uncharacterized protein
MSDHTPKPFNLLPDIPALLKSARIIAVVGLSADPAKPSYGVAQAMQRFGYRVVPISPTFTEWQGIQAYPTLEVAVTALSPQRIDIVNVFRRPEHIDAIVECCIQLKLPALWLQLGVVNQIAAARAQAAGITVVMDKCIKVERARLQ